MTNEQRIEKLEHLNNALERELVRARESIRRMMPEHDKIMAERNELEFQLQHANLTIQKYMDECHCKKFRTSMPGALH